MEFISLFIFQKFAQKR